MRVDEKVNTEGNNPEADSWVKMAEEVKVEKAAAAAKEKIEPAEQSEKLGGSNLVFAGDLPKVTVQISEKGETIDLTCVDLGDNPFSTLVKIDGQEMTLKEALDSAQEFQKVGQVEARQADVEEVVSTSQDGMVNKARPGDWIIQNPGEDPYVFGDQTKTLEERQAAFAKKYEPTDQPGVYQAKGRIKAIKVNVPTSMLTSWGERMSTPEGGWIADGGYTIAPESFDSTYAPVEK